MRWTNRLTYTACCSAIAALLLTGCVSRTIRTVDMTPPEQNQANYSEDLLLDIGVAVFDPNVPDDYEARDAEAIVTEVRKAESTFMPYVLKNLLESSANWGAVRVVPRVSNAVDLTVLGRVVQSDGEMLTINIGVADATGSVWFKRDYEGFASRYAYEDWMPRNIDPFQTLYKEIANDLLHFYQTLKPEDISKIRRVAQMRFAYEMAPEAFGDYLTISNSGRVKVTRLPAEEDPILQRVQRIREREYFFIDTLDEHYAAFFDSVYQPYQNYRRSSYAEASTRRRLEREASQETIAGAASIVGGLATGIYGDTGYEQVGGAVAITGGAYLMKSGFNKRAEAKFHNAALLEMAESLETEITPHTIALESEVLNLTGTVDEQYSKLRTALRKLYRQEMNLPVLEDTPSTSP